MQRTVPKSGFTLIEMVLVVAIIVLLVSMVIGIAKRIDDQGKERLCRDTLALIGNALEQFRDFGYEYKHSDFDGLDFPLDCNGMSDTALETILRNALYPASSPIAVDINQPEPIHDPTYSSSEALYFILSQVPECRTTLDKIDKSLLANKNKDGVKIDVIILTSGVTTAKYPFTRIVDPWKKTLRYDYYPDLKDYAGTQPYLVYRDFAKRTFPVVTSAGPDGQFDTFDDISSP